MFPLFALLICFFIPPHPNPVSSPPLCDSDSLCKQKETTPSSPGEEINESEFFFFVLSLSTLRETISKKKKSEITCLSNWFLNNKESVVGLLLCILKQRRGRGRDSGGGRRSPSFFLQDAEVERKNEKTKTPIAAVSLREESFSSSVSLSFNSVPSAVRGSLLLLRCGLGSRALER